MNWAISQILDHGTTNPIVARLTFQIAEILDHCDICEDLRGQVLDLYLNGLCKKLIRCWEISERYRTEFNTQAESYTPPKPGVITEVPHIIGLEQECHNFLYEMKNYIRDILSVINFLYDTQFNEASEFYQGKDKSPMRGKSLIDFLEDSLGSDDSRTKFLSEFADGIQYFVAMRNAVEHPGGYSGHLKVENFELCSDGKIAEPCWWREKDGIIVEDKSALRHDLQVSIENMLTLGEDIIASWAQHHLVKPDLIRIASVPEERRNQEMPVKWVVVASEKIEREIAAIAGKNTDQSTDS